jgi:hypothetical protein
MRFLQVTTARVQQCKEAKQCIYVCMLHRTSVLNNSYYLPYCSHACVSPILQDK